MVTRVVSLIDDRRHLDGLRYEVSLLIIDFVFLFSALDVIPARL
jgi:hypothetical protein